MSFKAVLAGIKKPSAATLRLGVISAFWLLSPIKAVAEDAGSQVPTVRAPRYGGPNRWEYGLDVKTTDFFGKKPTIGGGSPIVLTAQWNRKFETGTFLGITASTMAEPKKDPLPDIKSDLMTYYGGFNLAQNIFDFQPFRLTVSVSAGLGSMFIRAQPNDGPSRMNRADYRFVEPGAFLTLFEYAGLEWGIVGTFRSVRLINDYTMDGRVLGKNSDFSSTAYGLTFRTQQR
jgi:hypothetical protein